MNTPSPDEIRRLRNIWAAAYNNFDEYVKSGDHSAQDIKSMLLGISSEVFTAAAYLKDAPEAE